MSHTIINQLKQNYIDRVFISQLTSKHRMNNLWSWTMFLTHCLCYKELNHTLHTEFTVPKYSLYSSKSSGISHSNYGFFFSSIWIVQLDNSLFGQKFPISEIESTMDTLISTLDVQKKKQAHDFSVMNMFLPSFKVTGWDFAIVVGIVFESFMMFKDFSKTREYKDDEWKHFGGKCCPYNWLKPFASCPCMHKIYMQPNMYGCYYIHQVVIIDSC